MTEKTKTKAQIMNGKVVRSSNHTTIVAIERLTKHPKYGKYLQHRTTYKAQDTAETREVGEKVSIVACPPISKDKRFRILTSETK